MPCGRLGAARSPRRRRTIAAALLAVGLLGGNAASAQEPPQFDPAPPRVRQAPSPLVGTAFAPAVRLGQNLLGLGVPPRLRYVQSFAANPVGGITQGTDTPGVVIFGADVDPDRVVRLLGAQFHATFARFFGRTGDRPHRHADQGCSRSTIRRSGSSWPS